MVAPAKALIQLDRLTVSARVRKDLDEFVSRLIDMHGEHLVSITVFGSAVSGDYVESTSDLNLLVIYSDLNIVDLNMVSKLARRWFKKRRFAPRFLSVRNLVASARYFEIDLLEMRDAHMLLYGGDVLAGLEVSPADMRWQLAHDVKHMRMQVKQQFWKTAGDPKLMRLILIQRFTSLIHLMRALLFLENKPTSARQREVVETAEREFGIDGEFARRMFALKDGELKLRTGELVYSFDELMELIRALDARVDGLKV